MARFKIGDNVQVISCGQLYSGYDLMADKMKLGSNWVAERTPCEDRCNKPVHPYDADRETFNNCTTVTGTVIGIAKHLLTDDILIAIRTNGNQIYIYHEDALKLIAQQLDKELFEL